MKIHVIDNAGQIQPLLLTAEGDVTFYEDEIKALNALEVLSPGLILLNYAMRGAATVSYIELLLSHSPATSIVVVGEDLPDHIVLGCLLAGAKGYQNSRQLPNYIGKAVKAIAAGEAWVSRRMTARLLDAIRQQKQLVLNSLTLSDLSIESSISH